MTHDFSDRELHLLFEAARISLADAMVFEAFFEQAQPPLTDKELFGLRERLEACLEQSGVARIVIETEVNK